MFKSSGYLVRLINVDGIHFTSERYQQITLAIFSDLQKHMEEDMLPQP
ncbi:hypothetical protein [Peribacillus simplex]|nr:hypothetical protein [Peribacillus simplex]WHY57000.1 hypothetical protein QNH43_01270 [Peribacillus simplex]